MITLRRGRADDVKALAAIEAACFSRPWSEYSIASHLSSESAMTLVCEEDGEALGVLFLSCLPPEGEVYRLAVLPAARRRGIGRRLLAAGLALERDAGVREMFLDVRASNAPAIALYEGFGFSSYGRRANYYFAPREDAILMKRTLLEDEVFGDRELV
ncbi:MAG: ribosomal protein S18-alanine N-acetyltransferase [Clostridia bacterium]|nr:ribosomal protein S18-alanine N-acetyltransferase [Clostridia bacterium]